LIHSINPEKKISNHNLKKRTQKKNKNVPIGIQQLTKSIKNESNNSDEPQIQITQNRRNPNFKSQEEFFDLAFGDNSSTMSTDEKGNISYEINDEWFPQLIEEPRFKEDQHDEDFHLRDNEIEENFNDDGPSLYPREDEDNQNNSILNYDETENLGEVETKNDNENDEHEHHDDAPQTEEQN